MRPQDERAPVARQLAATQPNNENIASPASHSWHFPEALGLYWKNYAPDTITARSIL